MGLALTQTQPGFSPQAASASDIADTKAARAQLSGLRSQICSVKNTITGLTQMLEADKPGSTTPHRLSWKEAVMNIVQNNYFRDPKDRLANTRVGLFQAKEYLDALQKQVEPLEEADLIFKTNKKIVKKEARLAEFEAQKKPTHDDRKSIDALRAELDDLRTNRETLLIKYAARAMHMHAEAAMPFEQILQGCDLSQPAKMLCNAVTWITTPNMVAGGRGPLALPGLEAANATALYADAPLSRVPNGTSSNVETEPRQLQLQLRAVIGEQTPPLPADNNGNQAPAELFSTALKGDNAVSRSIELEREQRAAIDARIDALNFELTKKNPNCSDHAAILPLVTQLTGWPDTLKINIINNKGQLQASYLTGNDDSRITKTIFLTPTPNGYVLQGRNKQQPLFRLLAEQVSAASKLAKESFQDSNSRQGIAETIRQQTASLAKQQRPALFEALGKNAGSVKTDPQLSSPADARFLPYWNNHEAPSLSGHLTKLQEYFPALQPEQLSVLLEYVPLSSLELRDLDVHGTLPESVYNAAAALEQRVRLDRAKDGISNRRPYHSDTDLLAREVVKQQLNTQLDKTLIILEPGQRYEASSGTTSTVVLSHRGGGYYEALDLNNGGTIPTDNNPDSLFLAVSTALQPHERLKLGAKWENDVSGLRSNMTTAAEHQDATRLFANTSPRPERSISKRDFSAGLVNQGPSVVLENAMGQNDHLKGTAYFIFNNAASCTASLVDTRSLYSPQDANAYVFTAAHCIGVARRTSQTDQPLEGVASFNFFKDTDYLSFDAQRLAFGSQKFDDVAVVKLSMPLKNLINLGITPLPTARHIPEDGAGIVVVGAPSHIPPEQEFNYMRISSCTIINPVPIKMFNQMFKVNNEFTHQCQGIAAGASGGPVLTHDGSVIGVTSTIRSSPSGSILETKYGAQPVTHLMDCFDAGLFKPDMTGCQLYPAETELQRFGEARQQNRKS